MPRAPAATDVISVVTAFYRSLLGREPDQPGLDFHVNRIKDGSRTIEETLDAFLASEEFRRSTPRPAQTHASLAPARFTNDQSQFGEFGILLRHWVNTSARHRVVVDVGARGRHLSNSYDLLREFGWRGLLIEANPDLAGAIRTEFAELDFELVNLAISDYDGEASFHIGPNDDVSSLHQAAAAAWGRVRRAVTVQVRRLPSVLSAHAVPADFDLLSLDLEGEDIKVLNDLVDNSPYRPHWVIIEALHGSATKSLDDVPVSAAVKCNYGIIGQTVANLILERVATGEP